MVKWGKNKKFCAGVSIKSYPTASFVWSTSPENRGLSARWREGGRETESRILLCAAGLAWLFRTLRTKFGAGRDTFPTHSHVPRKSVRIRKNGPHVVRKRSFWGWKVVFGGLGKFTPSDLDFRTRIAAARLLPFFRTLRTYFGGLWVKLEIFPRMEGRGKVTSRHPFGEIRVSPALGGQGNRIPPRKRSGIESSPSLPPLGPLRRPPRNG